MFGPSSAWITATTAMLALGGVVFTAIISWRGQLNQRRTERKLTEFKAGADKELAQLTAALHSQQEEKAAERDAARILAQFRNPLMHSAYDLQSRIFNILRRGFLQRFYAQGSPHEQQYAVENTVFLVSQFLGWTEIIRQEIQFLTLDDHLQTKRLRQLQDRVYHQFQTDSLGGGFRLFAGEQRAVGELMMAPAANPVRCLGFAAFLTERNPAIDLWLNPLRSDLTRMAVDTRPLEERLMALHSSLIDLLDFLDPDCVWFPHRTRERVSCGSQSQPNGEYGSD